MAAHGTLLVSHTSRRKMTGMGMVIPKSTIMMTNVWHLNRDPEIYGADAAHLNPARFWTIMETSPRAHLKQKRKATSRTVLEGVSESVWESESRTTRFSSTLP